jgi:chemotaxis protein CheD
MLAANSQSQSFVGIGECILSRDPSDVIVASNLGSCLAIAAFDLQAKVGGLVHCLLPLSTADKEKAREKPCLYVDTGVVYLLSKLVEIGAQKKHLQLVVAGGAAINDDNGVFEIGKRNYTTLRKVIWKNSLLMAAEDVGGAHPRTLMLNMGSGEFWLRANGETKRLV